MLAPTFGPCSIVAGSKTEAPPRSSTGTTTVPDWSSRRVFESERQGGSGRDRRQFDVHQTDSGCHGDASGTGDAAAYRDRQRSDLDPAASGNDQSAADRQHEDRLADQITQLADEAFRAERGPGPAAPELIPASRTDGELARRRQAQVRDQTARLRDLTAMLRDRAAEARDRAAGRHADALLANEGSDHSDFRSFLAASGAARDHAARDRTQAAGDRERAAADRADAGADRRQARINLQRAVQRRDRPLNIDP